MFLMAVISFYVFISSAHKDFQSISFSRHSKMQNLSLTPLTPQQSQLRPTDIDLQYAVGNPISDDYLNSNTTNFSFSNALLYEPQSTFTSTSSVSDFPNSFDSEEVIGINAFEGLTPEQLFGSSTFTDPLADRTSASRFGSDFSGVFQPETQLVVVDSGVENWEQLVSDLSTNGSDSYEIVLLDQNSSGLDQITAAVQRFDRLGAIHIISHGDGSGFQLGNERITGDLSADDIGQIASWKNHLLADADLLIYGCDLASTESGRGLVTTLGELTGADVAASDDLTGNAAFGADWDLEFQTGSIDRFGALQALARSNWEGYLGTVNITQAWLDAQDTNGGPYVLDSANTNYVLQTDVTTSGTAFGITARNVTFDLNGHTITYNDSAPISVANHSFENGTGTAIEDWTFSAGATGERFRGEYLENTVYDGDHSLRFGITDGDQFARSNGTVTLSAKLNTVCPVCFITISQETALPVTPELKYMFGLKARHRTELTKSYGTKRTGEEFNTPRKHSQPVVHRNRSESLLVSDMTRRSQVGTPSSTTSKSKSTARMASPFRFTIGQDPTIPDSMNSAGDTTQRSRTGQLSKAGIMARGPTASLFTTRPTQQLKT